MTSRFLACAALTALSLTFSGCAKKVAAKAPPPPPPQRSAPATAAAQPAPARNYSQPTQAASSTPSRLPDAATRARIQDLLNRIQDAYFDYNKHTLRPDAEAALKTRRSDAG